jgi:hypothetical protein
MVNELVILGETVRVAVARGMSGPTTTQLKTVYIFDESGDLASIWKQEVGPAPVPRMHYSTSIWRLIWATKPFKQFRVEKVGEIDSPEQQAAYMAAVEAAKEYAGNDPFLSVSYQPWERAISMGWGTVQSGPSVHNERPQEKMYP